MTRPLWLRDCKGSAFPKNWEEESWLLGICEKGLPLFWLGSFERSSLSSSSARIRSRAYSNIS